MCSRRCWRRSRPAPPRRRRRRRGLPRPHVVLAPGAKARCGGADGRPQPRGARGAERCRDGARCDDHARRQRAGHSASRRSRHRCDASRVAAAGAAEGHRRGAHAGGSGGAGGGGRRGGGNGGIQLAGLSTPGAGDNFTAGRGVTLAAEPTALIKLGEEKGPLAFPAKSMANKFDWPGRPAPVVIVTPLTADQQKLYADRRERLSEADLRRRATRRTAAARTRSPRTSSIRSA